MGSTNDEHPGSADDDLIRDSLHGFHGPVFMGERSSKAMKVKRRTYTTCAKLEDLRDTLCASIGSEIVLEQGEEGSWEWAAKSVPVWGTITRTRPQIFTRPAPNVLGFAPKVEPALRVVVFDRRETTP